MFNAAPNGIYGVPNNFAGQGMVANQQQMPKTGNWLPADAYALLQKGASQFKLSVTQEDVARGQCNHYYPTGMSALIPDADGSGGCTCAICGTHFTSKEWESKEVEDATKNILDILNTIKIMYLSLDPNAALDYFQIIPFIEKIPQLYNIAVNDFKKYEGVDPYVQGPSQNPFAIFSMMTNPGYGVPQGGYVQQPAMNPAYAAPQGYPQAAPQAPPMYNPMYQQPVYQPQANGYAMNPMGAAAMPGYVNSNMPMGNVAPQAAPAAAPAAAEAKADAKVDTQFKK